MCGGCRCMHTMAGAISSPTFRQAGAPEALLGQLCELPRKNTRTPKVLRQAPGNALDWDKIGLPPSEWPSMMKDASCAYYGGAGPLCAQQQPAPRTTDS